jgi:hypothetical protein
VSDRPRYAIIPTNGRACLKDAMAAIQPQVDTVILVYTVDQTDGEILPSPGRLLRDTTKPVNISRWWNRGLVAASEDMFHSDLPAKWDVAILNDDAIVPEGWFEAVAGGMRRFGGAAACSGARFGYTEILTKPGPVPGWPNPLQGYAFMLAGEEQLRANEDLHWYFSDNYIDWESRKLGGTVVLPDYPVQHLYANGQMSPDLQVRVQVDAQNFVDLYGMRPW